MNDESERIERMRRYVEASYGGVTAGIGKREGAAAIGREAMLREVDRHSRRHTDEASQQKSDSRQPLTPIPGRVTPWRTGLFLFGKEKQNH